MLVVELQGKVKVLPPPYTQPDPTPFLQLTNVGSAGVQQGIFDLVLDPNFASNHFYYVFYTLGTPNRDRLSRFTANATNTGTVAGSELVLYQDPQDANAEHHGGALNFGNDGKLYFTTGEHFVRRRRPAAVEPPRQDPSDQPATAPCPPTTPSTTGPARTWTRSGRSGCATPTAPTTTPRRAGSTSATSAATTTRRPWRR